MLKITPDVHHNGTRLTVEGRLVGPWVAELERCWRDVKLSGDGPLVVDLTGITFIGEEGKALLHRMWRDGAELVATGCCTRALLDGMRGRAAPCSE